MIGFYFIQTVAKYYVKLKCNIKDTHSKPENHHHKKKKKGKSNNPYESLKQNTKSYPMNPKEVKTGQSKGKGQRKEQGGRQSQNAGNHTAASPLAVPIRRTVRLGMLCAKGCTLDTRKTLTSKTIKKILHNQ